MTKKGMKSAFIPFLFGQYKDFLYFCIQITNYCNMKTIKLLFMTGMLVASNLASAQTYYDLTDYYLVNASFDTHFDYDKSATGNVTNKLMNLEGWTKNEAPNAMRMLATFQYGTAATVYNNSIPAAGEDGNSDGGCLAMGAALGNKIAYYHSVTLPAGKYMLLTAIYNAHATDNSGQSLSGWLPKEGTSVMSAQTAFGNQQWKVDTIRFEVTQPTKGQIQIGYQSASGVVINASTLLLIDYVKLLRDTPYDELIDVQGDVPTVKTNKRFARGATMAFGRMTASIKDGNITERGFCWSENPEPTINDFTTTETLSNGVYWLKDLKPATMYYMRAYAKTEGRQIGYGEVIKFCTIPKGQISFSMRDGESTNTERIRQAAQTAVNWWNNLTEMKGFSTSIGYNPGTPTAECSYGGWMSVGSNQSYQRPGTIMHEMLHGVGVIPWADTEWSRHNLRSGVNGDGYGTGQWLGDRVTEVLRFWDNSSTAVLNGDYQHMWPYGINGAGEDNGSDVLYIGNSLVCQALGEDGLQHTRTLFAEPYYALDQEDDVKYYIKNESAGRGLYTAYLMPTKTGTLTWRDMPSAEAVANDSAAWYITFTPNNQYYQFRNAATGQYITYAAGFKTVARTTPTTSDNMHLMKGRVDVGTGENAKRGYWIISPASNWSPACMQANEKGAVANATFNIANSAVEQRWLILTTEEMRELEKASMAALEQKAKDILEPIKALADVPHTENENGVDNTFNNSIRELEQRLSEATTTVELTAVPTAACQVAYEFLCKVTATDGNHPFDLTYLISNAGIDNGDGWSRTPTINYSCGEFFETAFDFNQTLDKLPGGYYIVMMQGFQRPGTPTDAYNNYADGKNNVTAYLYAGNKNAKIAHIAQDAQSKKLGGREAAVGSNMYIPNDMQAASLYFKQGLYDNMVENTVENDGGSLKFGLRSSTMSSAYWVCFDNFRLYFLGKTTPDALGITTIEQPTPQADQYYDLQGRRVVNPTKGIYVVGKIKRLKD